MTDSGQRSLISMTKGVLRTFDIKKPEIRVKNCGLVAIITSCFFVKIPQINEENIKLK